MEPKEKIYTLYAKLEGTPTINYTVDEGRNNEHKRGQELMSYTATSFEDLDRMTSQFTSFDDLNKTFKNMYNSTKNLYNPIIFVDEDEKCKNANFTFYVVYAEDFIQLKNREGIRSWLLEYLTNNPDNITCFLGLSEIGSHLLQKYPYKNRLDIVNIAINIYFENEKYDRYREAYFKLKELDYRKDIKNEIHR